MSSSGTDRQGQVGDLKCKSKEELCELLLRQEKLLSNQRFLRTLPDKGKKILDFAERVRLAIAHHEEEQQNQIALSSARAELESKYQKAFAQQQHGVCGTQTSSHQNKPGENVACDVVVETDTSPVSCNVRNTAAVAGQRGHSGTAALETMDTVAAGASLIPGDTTGSDLVEAMQQVRLSDHAEPSRPSRDALNSTATENLFTGKQPEKKPHYMEVLERTEGNAATRIDRFKPNQLSHRMDNSSSGSSSPSRSPGHSSPLSAEARKERDRKHLDDITAARLPLLHYSPVQLLSLDQSATLLTEQAKRQQQLQAKVAAQKLAEGPRVCMGSYRVEGGPMPAYREVHDDGAQLSSEED